MHYEITPDCIGCGGKGRVAEEGQSSIFSRPCGHCTRRYDETHCWRCHARLSAVYLRMVVGVGYSGIARACSTACAETEPRPVVEPVRWIAVGDIVPPRVHDPAAELEELRRRLWLIALYTRDMAQLGGLDHTRHCRERGENCCCGKAQLEVFSRGLTFALTEGKL